VSLSSSPRARREGHVLNTRTFDALRRHGMRRRSGPVTVTVLRDPLAPGPRVAYGVSRAVGTAVDRNRVRRRLRAIVRDTELVPGAYLVSVSPAAAELPFDELAGHVRQACRP
jgi:ribonuclease P protein component